MPRSTSVTFPSPIPSCSRLSWAHRPAQLRQFVGVAEGLSKAPFGCEVGWRAGVSTASSRGGGEELQGRDTEPLSTVSSAWKDTSLLRNVSRGPPAGSFLQEAWVAAYTQDRPPPHTHTQPNTYTKPCTAVHLQDRVPQLLCTWTQLSVSRFFATRACPFQLTPWLCSPNKAF